MTMHEPTHPAPALDPLPAAPRQRTTLAASAALGAAAFFVALAGAVHAGKLSRWDLSISQQSVAHTGPHLLALMRGLSALAGGWALLVFALLGLAALLFGKARRQALGLLLAIGGGEALVNGLKIAFQRPRPSPLFAHLGYSFPSGHAFFAVTVYGMLTYWLTRRTGHGRRLLWAGSVLLIALIGLSRVCLGVHYASDVLAGFALGLPWLWTCLAVAGAAGRGRSKGDTR